MTAAAQTQPSPAPEPRYAHLDHAVDVLRLHAPVWARVRPAERVAILEQLEQATRAAADRWVAEAQQAKGVGEGTWGAAEDWMTGPLVVLRALRALRKALTDIRDHGTPRIPGPIHERPDGQVVARVFPATLLERVSYWGITGEVWMDPALRRRELVRSQAVAYQGAPRSGEVTLVLGAGNVTAIPATDVLEELFVHGRVVLLKTNPVNEYLAPLLEEVYRPLVHRGLLRVVRGGAEVGAYLTRHPSIDRVHITGSDRTHDAIVWGTGAEAARRRAEDRPLLDKPITSELGGVAPVIVVPGPWTAEDFRYQGAHLATMMANNVGFNCLAARVVVQHAGWSGREPLLASLRQVLADLPTRYAYYPGAAERYARLVDGHPAAERYGSGGNGRLPWALLPGLDPDDRDDPAFAEESFCPALAETALEAGSTAEYIDEAVAFANDGLFGTLSANLLVHPESLREPGVREALDRAVADLRYGTVGVNQWTAVAYALGGLPWGAFPGHTLHEVGSGIGVVHNPLMFSRAQKSVVRGPFRWPYTPPWFVTHRHAATVGRKLMMLEARPSLRNMVTMLPTVLRG